VIITELIGGYECECLECKPDAKKDLIARAKKELKDTGAGELQESVKQMMI